MTTTLVASPSAADTAGRSLKVSAVRSVRVLHVINGEHYAGAERVQDHLAGQLPELGFEVGFACVKPNRFPQVRHNRHTRLYELPMAGRFDLRPIHELVRIIRQQGYQLLHAHTPRSLLLSAAASLITGVPLVYHVHSPTCRDSTNRWRNRVNALIEWTGMLFSSALIAVSQSLGEHVGTQAWARRKLSVVPNGVPPWCSSSDGRPRPNRSAQRSEWVVGTVALFRPRKGIEVLLEALALLKSQNLPVKLRAVGGFETPEYERQIKRQTEKLGLNDAVDWVGFTRDVDAELNEMDLFVLPSLFGEGLPMVILEAMAAGVPVVATRVEGIPEAIRHGVDGLIAEPNNPQSLAANIADVVRGDVDWHHMHSRAIKRHEESFSDRRMAEGVAAVYHRVLGKEGEV